LPRHGDPNEKQGEILVPQHKVGPQGFVPMLATLWSSNPAKTVWTFKLRRNVKSCAGNTLTADERHGERLRAGHPPRRLHESDCRHRIT
jgi:ABC-type oligopeptide transport system substrate-binding subunit